MYALGIPNKQYRRTTRVLGHELSKPIPHEVEKQEDGFYLFTFPEVDEDGFRKVVTLLKNNGVTTIGADEQLTEKNIMKLSNLINLKPLKEQNTSNTSETTKVKVNILDDKKEATINYKPDSELKDVTISWNEPWGEEKHTVDFEYGENLGGSMAYDECNTVNYVAYSDDDKFKFILPVCVDPNPDNEEIWDWDWSELNVSVDDKEQEEYDKGWYGEGEEVEEGTCGYTKTINGRKLKTPGGTRRPKPLQERFQKLAGIKPLYEQGFDQRLAQQMGMSDDEFEDQIASRDIGSPFPGSDSDLDQVDPKGRKAAKDLIEKLKNTIYPTLNDEEMDTFSITMVDYFLDASVAAKDAAQVILGTKKTTDFR
jgi:hypothetical protein